MFGFRIIKEWDYKRFLKLEKERDEMENELREEIYHLSKDNASLREQLNEMIKTVHNYNSEPDLGKQAIIFKRARRCDSCQFKDSKKCNKIEICVCNKSDVSSFR